MSSLPIPFKNIPDRVRDLFEELERVSRSKSSQDSRIREMSLIMLNILEEGLKKRLH